MPRPYFHKLILSRTIQDRKLRIPESFLKKFGNAFSTFVRLAVPDGHVWRIGILKAEGKCWFYDSWQEFVDRYSIRVGYFLVFKYEGNAVFHVYIFNLSASEINYQSNTLSGKRSLVFEEMEDDEPVDKLDTSSPAMIPNHMIDNKGYNPSGLQSMFQESKLNHVNWTGEQNQYLTKDASNLQSPNRSARDATFQFNAVEHKNSVDAAKLYGPSGDIPLPKPKKAGRKKRKVNPTPDDQQQPDQPPEDGDNRFRFYESASARKRTVTAEERERAINAAKAFEPVNPFCRVVLRPSYLYRGCIMYLPSCFAEKNLNGVSGFIRLQFSDGKQWPVRCLYRGGRAKLSQGWYEFTLENNMGEGDVCVFELLRSRDIVLKVTVFRVLEPTALLNGLDN